ncbi:MAG: hypothetical protein ACLP8S_26720 [Solirubrobacteraceae bacterium]
MPARLGRCAVDAFERALDQRLPPLSAEPDDSADRTIVNAGVRRRVPSLLLAETKAPEAPCR